MTHATPDTEAHDMFYVTPDTEAHVMFYLRSCGVLPDEVRGTAGDRQVEEGEATGKQ